VGRNRAATELQQLCNSTATELHVAARVVGVPRVGLQLGHAVTGDMQLVWGSIKALLRLY
jgi:hypothetical protein